MRRYARPDITINQITWQTQSLSEPVNAVDFLLGRGVELQRTGRDGGPVNLFVDDVDVARDFYTQILGFEVTEEVTVWKKIGAGYELLCRGQGSPAGSEMSRLRQAVPSEAFSAPTFPG